MVSKNKSNKRTVKVYGENFQALMKDIKDDWNNW